MPIHSPYLLYQFSVTWSSIFFLWQFCGFISLSCQQNISQTSPLLHLNDFKTKSKLKFFFQSKEKTKLLIESHDIIKTNWISESSILLLIETEFLTSKPWNALSKKSMHEHMWLIFVVPTCNYIFDFFLKMWLWKPLTHMLFMWVYGVSSSRYHRITILCPYINTYTYIHIYIYIYIYTQW